MCVCVVTFAHACVLRVGENVWFLVVRQETMVTAAQQNAATAPTTENAEQPAAGKEISLQSGFQIELGPQTCLCFHRFLQEVKRAWRLQFHGLTVAI